MIDFTFKSYSEYLKLIKKQFDNIIKFDYYFSHQKTITNFCIIRHDVDRNPVNALRMAQIESNAQIYSTYYFRIKKNVFDKIIIKEISNLGHEIGYHYECLSDQKGNLDAALDDFETNLNKLRELVPVNTIAMHGRPFSQFDNRDLWKHGNNHQLLKTKFNIKGEIYLDIDYTDIAYINDTGRNWSSNISNIRDKVSTDIKVSLNNQRDLINYLHAPHNKLILLAHPERWNDNFIGYSFQFIKDKLINIAKRFI